MSEAINKAIVRRSWEEAWNTGNLAPIDERVDANDVLHALYSGRRANTELQPAPLRQRLMRSVRRPHPLWHRRVSPSEVKR
jgi:hypothetical protein